MEANSTSYEDHGDSGTFTFTELACLLTGVSFLPDTPEVLGRILRHLTGGEVGAEDMQFPGYSRPYPGAKYSVQDMLCRAIINQHPRLGHLTSQTRAFATTEVADNWLQGTAQLTGYKMANAQLPLAPLDHADLRTDTVLVIHRGEDTTPTIVTTVSGERIDVHETEPRFTSAQPFGCAYYLGVVSVWDGTNIGLIAKPGTCYPYTNPRTQQPFHTTGPFDTEHPPITPDILRVPAQLPRQRDSLVPGHARKAGQSDDRGSADTD